MSYVPGARQIPRFDRSYRGAFGRFKTATSYGVQYLLTSIQVDDLGHLSTASEVLDFDAIQFEELIQRDIDQKRVKKIADDYLRGGHDRPVFFPPLIACVALLEGIGGSHRLKAQYDSIVPSRRTIANSEVLVRTYDTDGFELLLPIATRDFSDRCVEDGNESVPFFDFAAELAVNSRRTKLVVLDGQHRLEALRAVIRAPRGREVVANVELPICIVWPAGAERGDAENITADFRDLFVTINNKAQQVSGHFLTLLDDSSNSAMVVRELADSWKRSRDGGWNRLHLLEWNTRENNRVDQRTRSFSVTTISVIAEVLEQHLFNVHGLAAEMLDLQSRESEIREADPEYHLFELSDKSDQVVAAIVKDQARARLLPAIDVLFRTLRPYADHELRLGRAILRVVGNATDFDNGSTGLIEYLNHFKYSLDDLAGESVRDAYIEFRTWSRVPSEDDTFFLSVFQRGLMRKWLRLCSVLPECSPHDVAKLTVAALNAFSAKPQRSEVTPYLSPEQSYCRRVLWKGDAVNYSSGWAKLAWQDILLATLVREDVRAAGVAVLNGTVQARAHQVLQSEGLTAAKRYTAKLWEETLRDTRNNLGDYFPEDRVVDLYTLRQRDIKEFERIISENASIRYAAAVDRLANQLQRPSADIKS